MSKSGHPQAEGCLDFGEQLSRYLDQSLRDKKREIRYGAGCPVRHESDRLLTPRPGGVMRQRKTETEHLRLRRKRGQIYPTHRSTTTASLAFWSIISVFWRRPMTRVIRCWNA